MPIREKSNFIKRTIGNKITGNPLLDHLNSQITTNNFNKRKVRELSEREIRKIMRGLDYSENFRDDLSYLRFLVNDNSNQTPVSDNNFTPPSYEIRSLADTIGPGHVLPGDGQSQMSKRWWTDTVNWIMRGNRNTNNNYDPVPCAVPPVYAYDDDGQEYLQSCSRHLEKVIDDGNEMITMADWSHILCEHEPEVYCQSYELGDFDCDIFCGSFPHPDEAFDWYGLWFSWWYGQQISWSHAGWDEMFLTTDPVRRSPVYSAYIYNVQQPGDPLAHEEYARWPGGRNRTCGPGYAVFPATAELINPDNFEYIMHNQGYTWTIKTAIQAVEQCGDMNLCGTCPGNESCIISVEESYCSGSPPSFSGGDSGVNGNEYQFPTMHPENELSYFYDGTALVSRNMEYDECDDCYYPDIGLHQLDVE